MPIYLYRCETCNEEIEKISPIGEDVPICHGEGMLKIPTFPVMIKWKGEGGYPSRRKQWKGIAAYTTGYDSTTDPNSEFYRGRKQPNFYGQVARSRRLSPVE